MLAIFIREAINETVLNPWKIFEKTRDGLKETKPKDSAKEKPADRPKEAPVPSNMTAERAAYEVEKADHTRLLAEQKDSSKRDLVS